jgi:hypothetical protein
MTLAHLSDDELVALTDASLAEDAADAARRHLDGCAACAARADAHAGLQRDLRTLALPPDPARAHDVARVALAARRPPTGIERLRRWAQTIATGRWAFAGAAAAAAVVLVVLRPATLDEESVFTARGEAGHQPQRDRHWHELQVFAVLVDDPHAAPTPLRDGAIVASGGTALAVRVSLLPASGAVAVAVFAQDATGRVTWLAPAWEATQEAPACLAVDKLPALIAPAVAVALPAAVGPLRTGLIVARGGACTLPPLDAHLEAAAPLPSGVIVVPGPTLQLR